MTTPLFINTRIIKAACLPPFINPQPWPLDADTADFSDFGDRTILATLGIFSCDTKRHRDKRRAQHDEQQMIDAAYEALGTDREREYSKIAAELEDNSGIWARSTGAYARRCHELDRAVCVRVYEGE